MNQKKHSGILCHLTSLPTLYGVGDFGPVAYQWVDELARADQSYWQILPVGNTDDSGCPYATDSAFGCADYYVSPDLLIKEYGLDSSLFDEFISSSERVDFRQAKINKQKMLALAYKKFSPNDRYRQFLISEKDWIDDYCHFRALTDGRGGDFKNWNVTELSAAEKEQVLFHLFCQFTCFSQLLDLKNYANGKGIKLVGDLPIFVSYNSMDVWKNPEQFYLNEQLEMEYETGAAPDNFSETGQKWGTPIYNWDYQKKDHYKWWNQRFSFLKRYFDVIRIDHFRGFCATWISPVSDPDARQGHWYPGPGADLFNSLGDYPEVIAEDLGYITPDVDQLRDEFSFPGMRVFQFMLGGADNPHKLYNYNFNTVAYSGTHDCDTLMGWFNQLSIDERSSVESEMGVTAPDQWGMLKVLMNTPSKLVLVQIQDVLGLGNEARFNYPGTVQDKNWSWKLKTRDLAQIDWARLLELTRESGRVEERPVCG